MSDDARLRVLRKKKIEEAMDLAFEDSELDNLKELMEDVDVPLPVDPVPPKNAPADAPKDDSFLGEAACGGAVETMAYLLSRGADPNYIGKHNRTALHRALYNEQPASVPILLEAGADPRLLLPQEKVANEETGELETVFRDWDPEEINGVQASAEIKNILKKWDIKKTLSLLRQRGSAGAAAAEARADADEEKKVQLTDSVQNFEAALAEAKVAHQEAIKLREQRILEFDTMKCEKRGTQEQLDMLERMIKQAEEEEVAKRMKVEERKMQARKARVALREQEVVIAGGLNYTVETTLKTVEDILQESTKVVFLNDTTRGTALKFFTYRPVMLLDLGHSQNMHTTDLRASLLSALRYGRVIILWLRDWDVDEAMLELSEKLDLVSELLPLGQKFEKGALLSAIQDGSIAQPKVYERLLTEDLETSRPEFHRGNFPAEPKLQFAFLAEHPYPPQNVLDAYYSVKITE